MPTGLSALCRNRVGITPFSNLALAIYQYAGEQLIGQSPKPLYAQGIEQRRGVRINPAPEEAHLRQIGKAFGWEVRRDQIEKPFSLAFRDGNFAEIGKKDQLWWQALPYNRDHYCPNVPLNKEICS